MFFQSPLFLAAFAVFFAAYWALPHRWQNWLLLLGSYGFYAAINWQFCALLAITTLTDYACGIRIEQAAGNRIVARRFLDLSLLTNLCILGFFKYHGFFVDSVYALMSVLGVGAPKALHLDIILPIGISFYTFQSISYTVDVYRRVTPATRNLLNYAVFLAFFPKLLAGPIERANNLLTQVQKQRTLADIDLRSCSYLFFWGLFKKVFVADNLGLLVDEFLSAGSAVSGIETLLGAYICAFRVYADFSGYTDMARGLAGFLGIRLVENFSLPYFSRSPPEIWRRWHASLSMWVRDYVFIPLGGLRAQGGKLALILILTMITMGIWHAASWNMLVWGVYHGSILAIYGMLRPYLARIDVSARLAGLYAVLQTLVVFHLKAFGELLSSSPSLNHVVGFIENSSVHGFTDRAAMWTWQLLFYTAFLIGIEIVHYRRQDKVVAATWSAPARTVFAASCICLFLFAQVFGNQGGFGGGRPFVYFKF